MAEKSTSPFGDVVYTGQDTQHTGAQAPRAESLEEDAEAAHTVGQLSLFGAAGGFAVEPGVDREYDAWGGMTYVHDQPPFNPSVEEFTD